MVTMNKDKQKCLKAFLNNWCHVGNYVGRTQCRSFKRFDLRSKADELIEHAIAQDTPLAAFDHFNKKDREILYVKWTDFMQGWIYSKGNK